MQIWSTNSRWFQLFKYTGDKTRQFINFQQNNKVLSTSAQDKEGQPIGVQNNRKATEQKWRVVYLDKADKTETEGLNEEFGFHINRPFYIVSELPFNRVAEMHGNTAVTLRRWRNNQRQ
jgi:hypothetical protein